MADEIRIALPPDQTAQDADYTAYRLNWDLEDHIKGDDSRPSEGIYRPRKAEGFVHRLDDPLLGFRYFLVTGADREAIAETIREATKTVSAADAKTMFDGSKDATERARAIRYVAVTAPDASDAGTLEIFRRALGDDALEVRQAAILATAYAGWPELAELLREVASNDADKDVREDAASMLEGFDKQSRGELE